MPIIKGQCHCGNLSCTLTVPDHVTHLTLYGCTCSYCRLHACSWLGNPAEALTLGAEMPEEAGWYSTGALHPHYLLCRHCGVVLATIGHFGDDWFGIMNAQAAVLPPLPQDFMPFRPDPMTDAERLQLRRQRWVKGVRFTGGLQPPLAAVGLGRVAGLIG